MFCPACGAEYREEFTVCADCDTALVEEPPKTPAPSSGKLVTVLEAHDDSLVMLAKGLLESADIPYFARNDQLQDLLGWGRIVLGFNPIVSPIRIQVPEDYAEAAREILERVDGSVGDDA